MAIVFQDVPLLVTIFSGLFNWLLFKAIQSLTLYWKFKLLAHCKPVTMFRCYPPPLIIDSACEENCDIGTPKSNSWRAFMLIAWTQIINMSKKAKHAVIPFHTPRNSSCWNKLITSTYFQNSVNDEENLVSEERQYAETTSWRELIQLTSAKYTHKVICCIIDTTDNRERRGII